jgi:hypothetical protein
MLGTAPASGAVFRALAENPSGPKTTEGSCQIRAQATGRESVTRQLFCSRQKLQKSQPKAFFEPFAPFCGYGFC